MNATPPVALPPPGHVLCPLADIAEGAAGVFEFREGHRRVEIFVLRHRGSVVAYVNDWGLYTLYQRSLIRTHAPICACRGT